MGIRFQDKKEKDLFEQLPREDTKIKKKPSFVLPFSKESISVSYENIIFLLIGFAMSCIIFFSLGVEKGRRDVGSAMQERVALQPTNIPEEKYIEQKVDTNIQDKYVIQLAAFKDKEAAERELNTLKKDGSNANIKKSGDYYQLYIGHFAKKENAEMLLKQLRERYKDCYIKKL